MIQPLEDAVRMRLLFIRHNIGAGSHNIGAGSHSIS